MSEKEEVSESSNPPSESETESTHGDPPKQQTEESLTNELANSYKKDGPGEGEELGDEDVFGSPPNDRLEDQDKEAEKTKEKKDADNADQDKDRGYLGRDNCGKRNRIQAKDHVLNMLRNLTSNGVELGEVKCLPPPTRRDLEKIFLKIKTEFSINLQFKGNVLYGAMCPMDVEVDGHGSGEGSEQPKASGSSSETPKSQLRKRQDKVTTEDCLAVKTVQALNQESAACGYGARPKENRRCDKEKGRSKEKEKTTKEKKVESNTSDPKKLKRNERLEDIKCRYTWLTIKVRSTPPKSIYDLIKAERLRPTDKQLEEADEMTQANLKPLRLAVLMDEVFFYGTAEKSLKAEYRSEMEKKKETC